MVKRIWVFGAWTSMLLGLACGSAAWAKPVDLPVPSQLECPDGTDDPVQGNFSLKLDLLSGRVTVEITNAKPEQPAAIDAISPALLPALFEQLLRQSGNAVWPRGDSTVHKDFEARRCFEAAERARRAKNYEAARRGYQQTHLLSPTTPLGRLAIVRLQEVEEQMRDVSEEQTDPPGVDPESAYNSMRGRTVPLGLVVVSY